MQLTNALPAALLAYAAGVVASPDHEEGHSSYTPAVNCGDDVCYSVVVPEATANSGSGPVWFQIYAPTRYAWVGLGTGSAMGNANMFIVYQDGNGNVTLSHRQASGFVMPEVPQDSDVVTTLLAGTGVSDGYMVANFRCDNCTTWKDGETLDFSSAGTPMIGAWNEGDSLDSTDIEAPIQRHNRQPRKFSLNLSTALKSTAGNPFVDQFAVPGESDSGDAEDGDDTAGGEDSNYMDNDDAEDTAGGDTDGESAGVGMFSLASGGIASAAVMMALSFVL